MEYTDADARNGAPFVCEPDEVEFQQGVDVGHRYIGKKSQIDGMKSRRCYSFLRIAACAYSDCAVGTDGCPFGGKLLDPGHIFFLLPFATFNRDKERVLCGVW